MTGKRYYLSTLSAWRCHSPRFAHSHWFALESPQPANTRANGAAPDPAAAADTPILLLVEADEGAHLALEDDPAFEPLPHPLAAKAISETAQKALAQLGVSNGATTFDVAEALARFHPLLRHRVF